MTDRNKVMKWELNVRTTLVLPRLAMKILGSYPIPKDSGRGAYLKQQFFWWFAVINGMSGGVWLGYNMVKDDSTIDEVLSSAPELTLLFSQVGKQLVCKIYHDELRDVLDGFERFLTESPPTLIDRVHRELRVVYIAHAVFIFGCVVDPLMFTLTPLIDGRPLPAHISFPWSLNSTAIYASLYVNEVIGAVTVSCMANIDVLFATLIWVAVIRFRYLNSQMLQAEEAMDTRECAIEQQRLIKYTDDLANVARWMAFVIVVDIFCMVTTGGVLLLRKPPLHEVMFYAMLVADGSTELMLYCWAADNLYDASKDLGLAALQCKWYGKSKEMVLNLRLIIQRCQEPVTISSPPLLPVLSREFFGSIMSTTFSYIATLRAISDT